MPRVSFVIPAHNEAVTLPGTLGAIRSVIDELALDAEVIVADDASSDTTGDIARAAGATTVRHEKRQISATRNLGARAASGGLLFFVDADTLVNGDTVRESIDAIERGAIGGGAMVRFDGWVPFYVRVMLVPLVLFFRAARLSGGAFFFCRADALRAVGGWDETVYAGEEIHLARALKRHGRFVVVPTVVVTSGRKARTHSAMELLLVLFKGALRGKRFTADRANLDFWYGPRRKDPLGR